MVRINILTVVRILTRCKRVVSLASGACVSQVLCHLLQIVLGHYTLEIVANSGGWLRLFTIQI